MGPEYKPIRELLGGVYTFGQPMVGGPGFADRCHQEFGTSVFRHVFDHDIVPRLPPVTAGTFKHFGREYRSTECDGWKEQYGKPTGQIYSALIGFPIGLAAWAAKQLAPIQRVRFPFSWEDHSPLHYIRCSQQAANAAATPSFLIFGSGAHALSKLPTTNGTKAS
jgi:hypothetical protein